MPAITLPRLIGHRGICALAPENTLGGIRKAAQLGVRWVELDVVLLGDGTPVICHDARLERVAGRAQSLQALSLADIEQIDVAAHCNGWPQPEPLPTLAQTLALLEELGMGLNLEIKDYGEDPRRIVQAVAAQVEAFAPERLILSSFSVEQLQQCRLRLPDHARGLITAALPPDWPALLQRLDCYSVHFEYRCLEEAVIRQLKACNYPLIAWTVNAAADAERLFGLGVDALISDCPPALGL